MKLDDSMISRFYMNFQTSNETAKLSAHLDFIDDLLLEYTYPNRFIEYYEI